MPCSPADASFEHIHRDPLPEGYSPVPPDALNRVSGGLRIGARGVLSTEGGCWHLRIRNPSRRRYGPARWLWHGDIDPTAPRRHRRRAWRAATGTDAPSGCTLGTSCGDANCISPHHLTIAARPLPKPAEGGRWAWIAEVDEETGEATERYGWIPDAPKRTRLTREERATAAAAAQADKRAKAEQRRAERATAAAAAQADKRAKAEQRRAERAARASKAAIPGPGKGSGRHARGETTGSAKITEGDVRAIRASPEGNKALGNRYGMSPQAIYKIRKRLSWGHVAE